MADYKVPGVYVEEPFGLSLSIQTGATAIPAFAFDKNSHKALLYEADKVTEIESWLAVTTRRQQKIEAAAVDIKKSLNDESKRKTELDKFITELDKQLNQDQLYQSLKLFFINGGGHCYVVPVDKLDVLVPELDDVTLLVQAGAADFGGKVNVLCHTGNTYFAIYDGPNGVLTTANVEEKASGYSAGGAFAAVYYPWLTIEVPNPEDPTTTIPFEVPPSGVVAGVYARVDRERGVWKAPANVAIVGAEPKYRVSDALDAKCNAPTSGGHAINVIRSFRGTGPLIWGARTLESNQDTWRYVPVRRLFNAAERDIRTAMSTALFEPNSAPTWERVRSAVDNYVHSLWQQGALLGNTPEQAYFVHIGRGVTMTDEDIKTGKMIVKVGLAAVRPAEFIVLQLTQDVVPA